jgi:zinc protease
MKNLMTRQIAGLFSALLLSVGTISLGWAQEVDLGARLQPESFTLKNGMQVVVIPDHRVPVVTHMVWFRVGAADEQMGKSGLAHFLEHLMSKGTKKLKPREFSSIVARNGGQRNAFTSYDFTAYFQRIALDRLPLVMSMQADILENLILTEGPVLSERDVVLEEMALRVENNPSAILGLQMNAALYQNHHYGTPLGGWRHELGALTLDDAVAWYDRYYAPNNAILIVAGDITAAELKPLAQKYYGPLKRRAVPERIRHVEPPQVAPRRVELRDARVQQPSWVRDYLAPSTNSGAGNESVSLEVLAYILGGSNNSRLFKKLVIEDGSAAGVRVGYSAEALNDTSFTVSATPRAGHELSEIEGLVDQEIARLLSEGVTEDEVAKAVKTLQGDAIYSLDNQMSLAQAFGVALTTGGSVQDVVTWPKRVGEVTAADVNAVAQKVLLIERSVTGQLLPKAEG